MTRRDDPKPNFHWPVVASRVIAASAEEVWRVISTPGYLEPCHPYCAANPVGEWVGEGARDEVHYLNGWVFERRFCRWIEGVGYDLEIGRPAGRSSFVSWRISPTGAQECGLRIAVYPWMLQNLPVVLRWFPYHFRVRPMMEKYLSSVTRGVEWYVTRGEPVPRNQFGEHPWFSDLRSVEKD